MKWVEGRLKSGYDKIRFFETTFPIPFDVYILRFVTGSEVPAHTDKVKSGKHYRLNIILKHAKEGGEFESKKSIINTGRVKLFRPDLYQHAVSQVKEGTRYVLSIGWIRK
jgi:hypothetical protein